MLLAATAAGVVDIGQGYAVTFKIESHTTGGACAGSGIGPTRISDVIGIVKAYTSSGKARNTSMARAMSEWLRKSGADYGVTTGRSPRCGWFDAVIARYATRVNGITGYSGQVDTAECANPPSASGKPRGQRLAKPQAVFVTTARQTGRSGASTSADIVAPSAGNRLLRRHENYDQPGSLRSKALVGAV